MRNVASLLCVLALFGIQNISAQDQPMTFFITSAGPGAGANLGGIEGADRVCQSLAEAAGSDGITWRAYLSTVATDNTRAVNARDRIGSGPWYNAKGTMIARNVADLHSENAKLSKENSLTENGDVVNGRGDQPNMHDVLTGSNLDGTVFTDDGNTNCDNWTSAGETGSARVGHHDRQGGGQNPNSWNSAHGSRGCSQDNLRGSGGNGLYYCFGM